MLYTSLLALALAATSFAQIPEGYRQVVITSSWNDNFVLQPATPVASGSSIVLFTLNSTNIGQQWYLKDGSTKIQLASSTLCLDAGTGRSNGSPLTVATCADTSASQKWLYNTDSQIVLDQTGTNLCADLYMGTVKDNTRVVIWQCIAGDKNHIWKVANVTSAVITSDSD
ncbi:ricin B lectin domain-containing protein [Pseudomassariella vexata]|uniref:Ricin B lectin domain-containing protein n=1 Tax=Pseudomassariella vexata TaxID=1141098 RepID=A0A1Y2DF77_9PEZI|nr:ricin B lectin domain-containing protein [Pseudomassariella vexata]ORY57847.1 ricin B lectin domain-containing protein [Pseudomassariella vexata]